MPMIMAGPEVPQGVVCREPVSLVDCFPTIVDCVGLAPNPDDRDLPGRTADRHRARHGARAHRLSEYHAAGAATGAFMIRKGKFKYVHYVGMPPQLFDLEADPYETQGPGPGCGLSRPGRRLRGGAAQGRQSRGGRRAGAQGPGRQDRQARRARGDPRQGQLRLLAGARHQAGLQLGRQPWAARRISARLVRPAVLLQPGRGRGMHR